ncbi:MULTISPECIES: LysR substrate-binding domain-containing protein [unclassified Kribbella]|uniref:LysR substrate-binding domain-containing protein n=1 Tax=unclassified Kribbella TaxID=2644121 RepID=UPI0033C14D89
MLFLRTLGPGLYDEITAACRRGDFAPTVTPEADQLQTIVGPVAAGCGVSILPARRPNRGRKWSSHWPAWWTFAIVLPKQNPSAAAINFAARAKASHANRRMTRG